MTLDPNKIDLPLTALVISIIALVISIASPSISFYVAWRDRARLKITSKYLGQSVAMEVTIVNAGRRPIVLKMVGFGAEGGTVIGEMLEEKKGGIRLEEHQDYTHKFPLINIVHGGPGDKELLRAEALWVEDTLGNRYKVPKSREHIKALRSRLDRIVAEQLPEPREGPG